MSTGGISIDRTDEIHPDNALIAGQAAQVIGLDVAGIDFLTPDISASVKGSAARSARSTPGPASACTPTPPRASRATSPARSSNSSSRAARPPAIPIIAVTGTNGKTTTSRMIAHILKMAGRGRPDHHRRHLHRRHANRRRRHERPPERPHGPPEPRVDAAVLETARGGIVRAGLGFDRCNVAIVTNVSADHLGLGGIHTIEDLARVKAVVAASTDRDGVTILNADDGGASRWRSAPTAA